MQLPRPFKSILEKSSPIYVALVTALATFCIYSCMYAFRKPFTVATYSGYSFAGIDLKILLVIAQLLGYTLSKFVGIRLISEMKQHYRALSIVLLIAFAWGMLLFFALTPEPVNIVFMFLNGVPLGMVWGLVFSYIEGRRATEFMGSVLAISFIFSSGMVKSIGKWLMNYAGISAFWMPFSTGAIFFFPLLFFVWLLEQVPPASEEDKAMRTERLPMTKQERRQFFQYFSTGLILLVVIYVLLSVIRDYRDNFVSNIWLELGNQSAFIFTETEVPISIAVLAFMSLLMLITKNRFALQVNHYMVLGGFLVVGLSTAAYQRQIISPEFWMICNGLGLYLGYIPFNVMLFERLIAATRRPANVGFLMYISDSFGYLGSIGILLFKNFGQTDMSYARFFIHSLYVVSIAGIILTLLSLIYFNQKITKDNQ